MKEVKKETKTKKSTTKKETKEKVKNTKKEELKQEKKVTVKNVKAKEKKEEMILNKKEQKWYKVLSKIVKIFAKVLRIVLMIVVPFVFLTMMLIPIIFGKYEVNANIIKFGDVNLVIREDNIAVRIGDEVQVIDCDAEEANSIMEFFNNNSKTKIIAVAETSLLFVGVMLVLSIYLLGYVEKIFGNFVTQNTPFTKENTQNIFMIGIMMCIAEIISIVASITSWLSFASVGFDLSAIVEILAVFVVYFIFKYATGMQNKVDTKIYE